MTSAEQDGGTSIRIFWFHSCRVGGSRDTVAICIWVNISMRIQLELVWRCTEPATDVKYPCSRSLTALYLIRVLFKSVFKQISLIIYLCPDTIIKYHFRH